VTVAAPHRSDAQTSSVDELVRAHLPLVGHLVREVLHRVPAHVSRDDLSSAGMLSLVLSAQNFDPELGVPFGRFAAIRIRGALIDELRTMDWASRAVRSKARDLESTRNQLTAVLGRTPRAVEVAQAMGVSVADLESVDRDVHRASLLSLQAMTSEDHETVLPSVGDGPEELLVKREQLGYLRDAIDELPERLRTVIEQYFFGQRRMAEIATELGVTESRISQLRSEALALLRAGLGSLDGDAAVAGAPQTRRSADARSAYCAAVATRSNVGSRLAATTALAEMRPRTHFSRAATAPVGAP
jgi:RNA polymerase sigma factor for flagellar operon FliA